MDAIGAIGVRSNMGGGLTRWSWSWRGFMSTWILSSSTRCSGDSLTRRWQFGFTDHNFALLSEFLGRVRSQGVAFHRSLYRILLSGYVRAGKLDSAIETFDDMVTSGCREFGVDYNRWISALCQSKRIELVEELLVDMDKFGCFPDIWACMTEKAENLIRKMEMSGINPDRYSYNILLKGLCKAHRLDKAFAFVSDHMEVGGFCDIISCNILIDAFCKAKKVNSALQLFKEMGYKGIQANAVTYGILINGLFSVNYYNLAEELFDQMLSTKIVPNVNVYNIMLHNLCKVGHFKHAQKIFWQMIQKEVPPDTVTFNTLIYWLGKNSRAIEALDLFKEMRARGVEPDSLTFKYMISGLLDEGKATLAYEVLSVAVYNHYKRIYNATVQKGCSANSGWLDTAKNDQHNIEIDKSNVLMGPTGSERNSRVFHEGLDIA
ncbi:hypothetical protein GUJ93_ZPchr0001g30169 [Zizania palustris]|uniref:Pentatricopeptide repeat-containing protein n=1 Tax=Zizania palustris TaxID=103762 RepID=A0A8J5RJ52_ZIZPA|nr:hypothetical protein GUJ93_ZPchr0001g30169 [Zizania palustris]